MDRQRDDDAVRWAGKAMALGRQLGLDGVVSDAGTTLAWLQDRAGNPAESLLALQTISAKARADGDVMAELRSLDHLGGLHFTAGRFVEALDVYQRATARAETLGRPWAPYGLDVRLMGGLTAYFMGDWSTAQTIVDVTGQSPSAMAEAALAAVGMSVSAGRGDTSALELLPHLRSWWGRDGMIAVLAAGAAIDLYGDQGDVESALDMHDAVVEAVSDLWQIKAFQARIRLSALVLGHLANRATRLGASERQHLTTRADELLAAATEAFDHHDQMRLVGPESVAWARRVTAEHTRLRWLVGVDPVDEELLLTAWQQTAAAFERLGHVFEVARSQARLAGVLRAMGRDREARALTSQARRRLSAWVPSRCLASSSLFGRPHRHRVAAKQTHATGN